VFIVHDLCTQDGAVTWKMQSDVVLQYLCPFWRWINLVLYNI